MIIRAYQPADFPALRRLLTELQTFEHAVDPFTREPSPAVMDRYFDDMVSWLTELDGMIFVAESTGELVGFVTVLILVEEESWTSIARRGHISHILVSEAYRGQGIAQRLLLEAENYARQKGCEHLMLDVLAGNGLAMKTYQRFGFQEREVLMHKLLT